MKRIAQQLIWPALVCAAFVAGNRFNGMNTEQKTRLSEFVTKKEPLEQTTTTIALIGARAAQAGNTDVPVMTIQVIAEDFAELTNDSDFRAAICRVRALYPEEKVLEEKPRIASTKKEM